MLGLGPWKLILTVPAILRGAMPRCGRRLFIRGLLGSAGGLRQEVKHACNLLCLAPDCGLVLGGGKGRAGQLWRSSQPGWPRDGLFSDPLVTRASHPPFFFSRGASALQGPTWTCPQSPVPGGGWHGPGLLVPLKGLAQCADCCPPPCSLSLPSTPF